MATTFRLEHSFPDISVELFEKHLNHPELIEMLKGMPAFRSRDLVDKKDLGGGVVSWKFKVVAGGRLPPGLPEEMLTWHEVTRFAPADHAITWTIEPLSSRVASLLSANGVWKLIPAGEGTKRVIEGTITVKIPLLGKKAEEFIAGELKKNYDVEPEIQRRFYAMMKTRT